MISSRPSVASFVVTVVCAAAMCGATYCMNPPVSCNFLPVSHYFLNMATDTWWFLIVSLASNNHGSCKFLTVFQPLVAFVTQE